ncbi:MAG: CotH kinase family protein, partial [Opitutales bacterium]
GVSIADEDDDYEDWIELYNAGDEEISLSGYGLSDDYGDPFRWTFPEVVVIPSGEFLLIWASGKDRVDPEGPLHTNYSIASAGEEVLLTRPDGVRLDELTPTPIPRDVSYGRSADGSGRWVYFPTATPDEANRGKEFETLLENPEFSHLRGFFSEPFYLEIRIPGEQEDWIRYTLDGTDPEYSPSAVISPAPVTIRIDPDNVESRWAGTPAVTVRAQSVRQEWATATKTYTYIFPSSVARQTDFAPEGDNVFWHTRMDPEVTEDERYRGILEESLQSIPTLSVVLDPEEMFGAEGIHRGHTLNHRLDGHASVELIYPDAPEYSGYEGFQVNAGVRIQGAGGRWEEGRYDPKQSFTIKFSRWFGGPGSLHYPFFESAPLNAESAGEHFNRLILRGGHNKSWASPGPGPRQWTTYTRQQYLRDTQNAASGLASHGTFMHLYINGVYWGLYNPSERLDHTWMSTYHGGEPEEYWSAKLKEFENSDKELDAAERFHTMLEKIEDPGTPYAEVKEYLDTENFIDWQLIMMLMGTSDYEWTVAHRKGEEPGPIQHFVWDLEDSLEPDFVWDPDVSFNSRGHDGYRWWENTATDSDVFRRIRNHPEFRMEFADRLYRHCLLPGGALTDGKNKERWLALADYVEMAVVAESARWGSMPPSSRGGPEHIPEGPINRDDHWYKARDVVLDMLEGNTAKMVDDMRVRGLYPEVDPPLFGKDSGVYPRGTNVAIDNPNPDGTVYYTLDNEDPRMEGGEVHPSALSGEGFILDGNLVVKARVKDGDTWSALSETELRSSFGFVESDYFRLAEGPYTSFDWAKTEMPGTYPPHMVFQQTSTNDPLASAEMDGYWTLPYNLESRSRITGLGSDGFAFINTANAQDMDGAGFVGTAVLALDTTGQEGIRVVWTGGTVEPNSRVYFLQLQYRVGEDGPFVDVFDTGGNLVAYRRNEQRGHAEVIGPVLLPPEVDNQPKVQLRWKYSYTGVRLSSSRGARSQLRVSDIGVFAEGQDPSLITYSDWRTSMFPAQEEQDDNDVSGPEADPFGEGVSNLLRFAFGIDGLIVERSVLPRLSVDGDRLSISFVRDPLRQEIAYLVEASSDLLDWSEVLYDSRLDAEPNNEGSMMRIEDSLDRQEAPGGTRFLRVRVILSTEPFEG